MRTQYLQQKAQYPRGLLTDLASPCGCLESGKCLMQNPLEFLVLWFVDGHQKCDREHGRSMERMEAPEAISIPHVRSKVLRLGENSVDVQERFCRRDAANLGLVWNVEAEDGLGEEWSMQ